MATDDERARVFGFDFNLKPFQTRIIDAALAGQDTFVLMATGGGKSLCYQLPPLLGDFVCLVISPLISLMQNQVLALVQRGIKACFLGSETTNEDVRRIYAGDFSIVYMTAEKLQTWLPRIPLIKRRIGLIAVDEAHVLSEWGHDFRPEFRCIHRIRDVLPDTPVMCLTATATARVRDDILISLLRGSIVSEIGSFDRPNLTMHVTAKQMSMKRQRGNRRNATAQTNIEADARRIYTLIQHQPISIIYCLTQKETEQMAELINECHDDQQRKKEGKEQQQQNDRPHCLAYHAGMKAVDRTKIHDDFVANHIPVLTATTAFGMGIDKPDIRVLIHYGVPKSMETYYQQIGRAGRDGKPSQCICFWSGRDFHIHKFLNAKSSTGSQLEINNDLLLIMKAYVAEEHRCRRALLLNYFNEPTTTTATSTQRRQQMCCDNCNKMIRKTIK